MVRVMGFRISAMQLLHDGKKTSSGIWSREKSESQVMFYSEQWARVHKGENGNTHTKKKWG